VSQEAPKQIPTPTEMARLIDHTLLAANASREEVERICKEALRHRFWSVCVNSGNVRLAASYLSGSDTQVCAVVGFPLGAAAPGAKAFEAREAVRCGAGEIDMVMNIGALRSRDYGLVTEDIRKVVQAVPGKVVKVILETGMLDQTQKSIACALAKVAGATFVKTSTGFGPGGATAQDIALMRAIVGPELGVKASGGVGSYNDAVAMLKAGANRIGASRSVSIVTNTASGGAGY
jgi:deoxyribose-phosphate aldolase